MKYIRTQVLTASEAHELSKLGFILKYKQVVTLFRDAWYVYVKDDKQVKLKVQ